MDLYAFSQIDNLKSLLVTNGIDIPRLRGIRAMWEETPADDVYIADRIKMIFLANCEFIIESDFNDSAGYEISSRTRRNKRKYMKYSTDDYPIPLDVKWDKIHGKKRKIFKFELKKVTKSVNKEWGAFNKYCGRKDVLCIHSRIGGGNWIHFNGPELSKQPWFIEKVDDPFDSTYCDIYVKISPVEEAV